MRRRIIRATLLAVIMLCCFKLTTLADDGGSYIKDEYKEYALEASEEYGIDYPLILAIIEMESSGRADAKNGDCVGLMQVSTTYHSGRAKKLGVDINDPRGNIFTGVDYLSELAEKYEVGLALSIYNGNKNAFELDEKGEMSKYAKKVLDRAYELDRYYYGL